MILAACVVFGLASHQQARLCLEPPPATGGCYQVTYQNRLALQSPNSKGRLTLGEVWVDYIVTNGFDRAPDLVSLVPKPGFQVFPEVLEAEEDQLITSEVCGEALG